MKSRQQVILAAIILIELFVFSFVGTHFFSAANVWQILRLNVELGLIALAMTPVIVTGGIDLSVGSMMGLAAVCFGALNKNAGLAWPIAAGAAVDDVARTLVIDDLSRDGAPIRRTWRVLAREGATPLSRWFASDAVHARPHPSPPTGNLEMSGAAR